MYSSQHYRQSAVAVSKPSWQRKNVNKQRPSDSSLISKSGARNLKSGRKSVSSGCRKGFLCDREVKVMSDSPTKKPHPAKQIRRGHCLTFKKNRFCDEELLEVQKCLESSDNNPVITSSDKEIRVVQRIRSGGCDKDVLQQAVVTECSTSGTAQRSGHSVGSSGESEGRGSRSDAGRGDTDPTAEQRLQESLQEARCCATGATGSSTGVLSRSNSSGAGSRSSHTGSTATGTSHHIMSSSSCHTLPVLDRTSFPSNSIKELPQSIPSRPTTLPLGDNQVPSNLLPPSHERTVIGRELTPPRKESNDSNPESSSTSQSSSNTSSSSGRSNKGPPPFKNPPLPIESNVREEADGSEDPPDPEIEELSRLRCTSDSTEVIAERENRRRLRQRRCADYPGLAFGSSMFSSDTMMRFNIIRNELHNIMNSQLKRVSVYFISLYYYL